MVIAILDLIGGIFSVIIGTAVVAGIIYFLVAINPFI